MNPHILKLCEQALRSNEKLEPKAFTFILDKRALHSTQPRRFDRNIAVDPTAPVHLIKCFMNDDGTLGSVVRKLAPGNPYEVSEENATKLAGANWERLPIAHVNAILAEFKK